MERDLLFSSTIENVVKVWKTKLGRDWNNGSLYMLQIAKLFSWLDLISIKHYPPNSIFYFAELGSLYIWNAVSASLLKLLSKLLCNVFSDRGPRLTRDFSDLKTEILASAFWKRNMFLRFLWIIYDPYVFSQTKAKGTLMQMVGADWLRSDKRENDLAGRPGGMVQVIVTTSW